MVSKFETQIDKFIIDTEEKLLTVVREAISAVVEDAQLEGRSKKNPLGKGGRMRIDTGFLSSTGLAQLGSLPSGPSRGDPKGKYSWKADQVGVVLSKLQVGQDFYFGWTAQYARKREAYDGFLEGAVQKWQQHVDASVNKYKK